MKRYVMRVVKRGRRPSELVESAEEIEAMLVEDDVYDRFGVQVTPRDYDELGAKFDAVREAERAAWDPT